MNATTIARRGADGVIDLLGPTIEFLSSPLDPTAIYCLMIGIIPPGGSVPLHSHADVESFYVLSRSVQVWCEAGDRFEWREASPQDFVHVPGGVKHAFRNTWSEPVVEIITTTPKLGKFFLEVGRRLTDASPLPAPGPADLERFSKLSAAYGYWNASPQKTARIGINL